MGRIDARAALARAGLLATGGWDSQLKFWDPRSSAGCVATAKLPDRAYTMDARGDSLVVGTAGRHVLLFDARASLGAPTQARESSLKYQTRCIRCFVDGTGA